MCTKAKSECGTLRNVKKLKNPKGNTMAERNAHRNNANDGHTYTKSEEVV